MEIQRIDNYTDSRFSEKVLKQHGGYLIENNPYEIEIVSPDTAIVRGMCKEYFGKLIDEFRFHAPQIFFFMDEDRNLIRQFDREQLIIVPIENIQPSQFYVDTEKMEAISTFIHNPEDVIIQVIKWNERYISLDGHTRLCYAVKCGFTWVKAVISETDDWVWNFVEEAQCRGIYSPKDLKVLPHEEYEKQWNQYCDSVFSKQTE